MPSDALKGTTGEWEGPLFHQVLLRIRGSLLHLVSSADEGPGGGRKAPFCAYKHAGNKPSPGGRVEVSEIPETPPKKTRRLGGRTGSCGPEATLTLPRQEIVKVLLFNSIRTYHSPRSKKNRSA